MGKIYDALEKSRRESLLINKGLAEPPRHKEQRHKELRDEDPVPKVLKVTLPRSPDSKKKKRLLGSKKNKCFENLDYLITEQFRLLKTRVFYTKNGNPPRTLLITSALPQEGKSMVAANLAISLAQSVHEHALLVDCDFRNPDLHKLFDLEPERGLADYLSKNADIPAILLKTEIPKLTLLPVGRRPLNPLDLMASERMKNLVQELKARYNDRYIIFDSAPIQLASETRLLLSQVDGIIMVVRAGKTDKEIVLRIIREIDKEKVLGIVLNCLPKSISNKQYYTYQHY